MVDTPTLGIVIPCFQEATRLARIMWPQFAAAHPSWDFIFVDDGSTDATYPLLQNMAQNTATKNIFTMALAHQGKATAVQAGINHLLARLKPYHGLAFYDADLATPLAELERLGNLFLTSSAMTAVDALFAARIQYLGTNIQRHAYRHYLGRIFATVVSLMVDLPVYDSQCGLKLFKTSVAQKIFKRNFVSPWFFDVELILRLKALKAKIQECPLRSWSDQGGSKLRWSDFSKTPFELAKIYWQYRHDQHLM